MTIEQILDKEEGQTFDRKSIQISPKALAVSIVAFANADGGTIAIGISDQTRRIEGIDLHTKELNELLRVPFDFCIPTIAINIEYVECVDSGGSLNHVVLMQVPQSGQVHANQADEVFYRVGDKSKKLSFAERMQLLYDKGSMYYEDSPAFDAELDDLDFTVINEYLQVIGYKKSALEYLRENKNFVRQKANKEEISLAAILLFGKYPQRFLPRARVRFIRYEGKAELTGARMNVIKDVVFEGRILQQIQQATAYLQTQIKERTFLAKGGQFVTIPEYPEFVRQEILVNSVTHRDYSIKGTEIQIKMFDDRIQVESPGTLPGLVRLNNLRSVHFSRNPKIAEFLKDYKYVK